MTDADIIIVGAGAAGLTAAIFAGETATQKRSTAIGPPCRIVVLDGAKKPGAKILVSGGGRCNVTNDTVTPDDYSGAPRPMIRNVLREFDEIRTREWMRDMGVELKLEPDTGKYFPTTDSAKTVLAALLRRLEAVGATLVPSTRVVGIQPNASGFAVQTTSPPTKETAVWRAKAVIVATGGLALPKSGSDGWGIDEMRRLGHDIIPLTPALVPLILSPTANVGPAPLPRLGGRFAEFSGLSLDVCISVYDATGRKLKFPSTDRVGALLFTHVGISGPAAMDISRHWLRQQLEHPETSFTLGFAHPDFPDYETAEKWLRHHAEQHPRREVASILREKLPERLARALVAEIVAATTADGTAESGPGTTATKLALADADSGVSSLPFSRLTRDQRKRVAHGLSRWPLPVVRDRGYSFAETSAGGVNLREVEIRTMMSRKVPNLFLCGEMLDVDGRIGGFNFQWAWATGYLAGRAAAAAILADTPTTASGP